jgi:hypothetical protein
MPWGIEGLWGEGGGRKGSGARRRGGVCAGLRMVELDVVACTIVPNLLWVVVQRIGVFVVILVLAAYQVGCAALGVFLGGGCVCYVCARARVLVRMLWWGVGLGRRHGVGAVLWGRSLGPLFQPTGAAPGRGAVVPARARPVAFVLASSCPCRVSGLSMILIQ